ncbi:MAG TPA: outer membrane protein transport protein [Solimonas sp.]|nr:outer membrane protein transport protein [Solimonas sp.]
MESRPLAMLVLACLLPGPALAGYGVFAHGYGMKSEGAGGVGLAWAEDSSALAANSAAALSLGRRVDAGLDWIQAHSGGSFRGNAAGPDQRYDSRGQEHFFIPQAGYVQPLRPDLALGVTMFSAGFGTDYEKSPYTRFGGAPRAGIKLMQSVLSTSLAWAPIPSQHLGVGLNLAYQEVNVDGLGFLAPLSVAPANVSDQGADSAYGYSLQLGWQGRISKRVSGGVAWRSRTKLGRFQRYRGLLPNGGELDLPAIYGAGLVYRPVPVLALSFDLSRVDFAEEAASGNSVRRLSEGRLLGSDEGPGFGWRNQTIGKLGASWQATSVLRLRAGYSRANRVMPPSETFLGLVAPVVMRQHYTLGATLTTPGAWEWTGFTAYAPRSRVAGEGSIASAFGGGEADLDVEQVIAGFSIGRRF